MAWLFIALCVVFVAGLLLASYVHNNTWIKATKTAASVCFVLVGILSLPLDSTFGKLILMGLVLGAVGDVFLLGKTTRWFLRGLLAFLIGHIAYVTAFASHGVSLAVSFTALLVAIIITGRVVQHYWQHIPQKMRMPSLGYATILSVMVISASGATAFSSNPWFILGALMFYTSELSVTRNHFLGWRFSNVVWGLPLYYGAQLIFASLA